MKACLVRMWSLFKVNMVLGIALIAAFATSFVVPPDRAWLEYFDLKTLTCLFCVLPWSMSCAISCFSRCWQTRS